MAIIARLVGGLAILSTVLAQQQTSSPSPPSTSAGAATSSTGVSASPASGATSSSASATTESATLPDLDVIKVVNELFPTAALTSLSPEMSNKVKYDLYTYKTGFDRLYPPGLIGYEALRSEARDHTTHLNKEQIEYFSRASVEGPSQILADPTGFAGSLERSARPFAFYTVVTDYVDYELDGFRSVIAADLSLPIPPKPTPTDGQAPAAVQTGVVGIVAALAAAAGAMAPAFF